MKESWIESDREPADECSELTIHPVIHPIFRTVILSDDDSREAFSKACYDTDFRNDPDDEDEDDEPVGSVYGFLQNQWAKQWMNGLHKNQKEIRWKERGSS